MKRLIFPLILFVLLVSEGVALDLLPSSLTASDTLIVPHWVLMFLVLLTLFYDTNDSFFSIMYGVAFGFLIDVVYSIVGAIDAAMSDFLLSRFLPTLLANILFLIPAYVLSAKWLQKWGQEQFGS